MSLSVGSRVKVIDYNSPNEEEKRLSLGKVGTVTDIRDAGPMGLIFGLPTGIMVEVEVDEPDDLIGFYNGVGAEFDGRMIVDEAELQVL